MNFCSYHHVNDMNFYSYQYNQPMIRPDVLASLTLKGGAITYPTMGKNMHLYSVFKTTLNSHHSGYRSASDTWLLVISLEMIGGLASAW